MSARSLAMSLCRFNRKLGVKPWEVTPKIDRLLPDVAFGCALHDPVDIFVEEQPPLVESVR
jgi:hypothetical protein